MNGAATAKQNIDISHQFLEGTMADVTDDIVNSPIPGKAIGVGVSYAHVLISEDGLIAGMLQGGAPLFASSWANRTGLSEAMPAPGPDWAHYGEWTERVTVDLPAAREYAQAVYAATDAYVSGLSEEDLDRVVDLSALGLGNVNVGFILNGLVAGHANMLNGEISAAKGVLGRKGYQF